MAARFSASIRRLSASLRTLVRNSMFGPEMLEGLARVGYAARGLVFLFVGLLAGVAALSEARPPSLAGAFSTIDRLPGGWLFLLALALGLFAYGGWRLVQALLDLMHCGWDAKGLLRRAGMVAEAILYAGLGGLATVIALSRNIQMRDELREEATFAVVWTARILHWPQGHWIVAAIGLGAIAMGCGQLMKARRTAFEDIDASERAMAAIRIVGRLGFAAKGTVLGATGVLFLIAAWQAEAAAVGGMRAALTALAGAPLGDWALLGVAVGLALYGVFSLIKAWHHEAVKP